MSRGIARRYAFRGKLLTMDELAEISSWSKTHLRHLINDKGIPAEKAVLPLKTDQPPKKTYEYQGRKLNRSQLARATGIPIYTLTYRLNNWTFEEAVKKERRVKPGSRLLKAMTPEGEKEMTMAQWEAYRGIELVTISQRKRRGWTDEQALGYAPPPSRSRKKDAKG